VLAHAAYRLLGLRTFSQQEKTNVALGQLRLEIRHRRRQALFIAISKKALLRLKSINYNDLIDYGSETAVRAAGKMRQEGRDYVVQDGDIMFFKFNV